MTASADHPLGYPTQTFLGGASPGLSLLVFFFCAVLFSTGLSYGQDGKNVHGVYEYVVESAEGTFEEIAAAIDAATTGEGWQRLASVDAGVPEGCPYKARVFVLYEEAYTRQLMDINRKTAPFAVLDRINLFEDENGIHVAVVNPHSINRTVLMDDVAHVAMTENHLQALRDLINGAVQGTASDRTFGKKRKKGYIGKTMGVMAGGPFEGKIKDEAVISGDDWGAVAADVRAGLSQTGAKWGTHLVYELELPAYETVIFGSSGTQMDSKSFSIVKAGGDKSRKDLACPGLSHAGAYPVEVVVAREDDGVKVRYVNMMYRMKMYFEDAGKIAFMKNMGMPGSLAGELSDKFNSALGIK